jgi:D-alanyl-D-alanine carboxypeptidase
LAAAGVLAVTFGVPATLAEPVRALGRLPSCGLGDVYTVPRGYDDWSVTLVDRLLRVEADYVPPDLVKLSDVGLPGGGYIRAVAVEDTKAMAKAARAAGAPIGIWSPYRSFKEQTQIFNGYVAQNGFDSAITYSQVPGHSEHQLGLGVDFMSAGGGNPLPGDWAKTPAGAWMAKNSWKYGWVLSYPRGEGGTRWNDKSCFRYEPWHYRYLGREMAAKVHASGLTIREYLWANHTQLDRNGKPVATPTPTPSATSTPTTTSPTTAPTASTASTLPTSATPSAASTATPGPTTVAQAPVSRWLGLDPTVFLVGALALIGLLAAAGVAVRRALSRR